MFFHLDVSLLPTWSSLVGGLQAGLACLGDRYSEPWVAGLCGYAFVLNVHPSLCPSGPTGFCWDPLLALAQNPGRRLDVFSHAEEQDGLERAARELGERVRASLAGGRPVLLWNLHLPEFYLVHGCDEQGCYFGGPAAERARQPKPWAELGRSPPLWGLFFGEPSGTALERAIRAALAFAVAHARQGVGAHEPYRAGLAGYALWAASLRDPERELDPWGAAYNARVWYEARANAAAFLQEAGDCLGEAPLVPALRQAAAHYRQAAEALGQVVLLFPPAEDGLGQVQRQRAADLIEQAARAGEAGVVALAEALEKS